MSNMTNTTDSCLGLTPLMPQEWLTHTVSDPFYNTTGCSVPSCGTNPATLAKCSNTTVEALASFNGPGNDTYLSHTLPKNTSASTYQAYQNCLLNNNAVNYLCKTPYNAQNGCLGSTSTTTPTLAYPPDGGQVCAMRNTVNFTRVMGSCCNNLQSDLGGCQIACWKKYEGGSTLAECLTSASRQQDIGVSYICSPSDAKVRDNSKSAGSSLRFDSPSNILQVMVSGMLLLAIFL